MGYIYIVKNDTNNKVYIGKTSKSLKVRWSSHLSNARNESNNSEFYRAIREIGESHFKIELIGEFPDDILDIKEIEYINIYDSFNNGYNSTRGGELGHRLEKSEEDDIVNLYKAKYTYKDIHNLTGHDCETIKYVLIRNGIGLPAKGNNPISIIMYNINFEPQKYFISKGAAYKWLVDNENLTCKLGNFVWQINKVISSGGIRYGHRWQLLSDVIYDSKVFRSKFDVDAYKNGNNIHKANGANYWLVDRALEGIVTDRECKCKICGKAISKGAMLCRNCATPNKLTDELTKTIQTYIASGVSCEYIGNILGIPGKTIRQWCKKLGLSESIRQKDISGIYCKELNIHFSTFREASEYLIDSGYSNSKNVNSLAYRISQHKGKQYLGFTWI